MINVNSTLDVGLLCMKFVMVIVCNHAYIVLKNNGPIGLHTTNLKLLGINYIYMVRL